MTDQHDPDERLVGELRALFSRIDPVPPLVSDTAKASLGWRRLDADLAELLSDSALETDTFALARGASASVRSVSFSVGALTIDIEVHRDDDRRLLLGQLSPPAPAQVKIQSADGSTVAAVESDSLGRFRAQLPAAGTIRLRVAGHDAGGADVETSWITV